MKESIRLVQLVNAQQERRVAVVKEPALHLLTDTAAVYDLAFDALETQTSMEALINARLSAETIDYDAVYNGQSEWRLLPSFDYPQNPAACMVSGTGLTHKNSALNRQMMHQAQEAKLTDSMQMYQWGLEGGHPGEGAIGVQPEWFYKGVGNILQAHGQPLEVPCFGNDGGEEPEVAGVYVVDKNGQPRRIGFTTGNEFSDHIMEKKNYLYLAPSKLRSCAIGPELVLTNDFDDIKGNVGIIRENAVVWSKEIQTGQQNMAHSLSNLEHHHFKYSTHRIPGQAHVHFFGADAFSFGAQVQLQEGDVMQVEWYGLGRALKNPLKLSNEKESLMAVAPML